MSERQAEIPYKYGHLKYEKQVLCGEKVKRDQMEP
jgi:hypothetical protein